MRRINLTVGLALIVLISGAALLSYIWLPHDPARLDFTVRLAPPSARYVLGTDHFGRDLLSRLLVGARGTLYVGIIAVTIALIGGGCIGMVAGYVGGLLAAIFEPGTLTAMTAIGLATIPIFARLMRSSVLSLKSLAFVEAGQALGLSSRRILLRHIVPNALSPMIVQASLSMAVAVLAEAALSFLGLGTPPNIPSWGNMLRDAQGFLALSLYPALVPGLAIVVTVLGWSLFGDGLRDQLDPRSKGR
jgi:peptide/nickel transport system permease protein